MRRIKRTPDMADQATEQIRSAILSGDLPPGARIRQEDLAARLAVSRAPIRQALLVLEREGLVQSDRWRGTIVAPLDATLIRDLYEFRGGIERYVASTLAQQPALELSHSRETVVSGYDAAATGELPRLIHLDLRFHTELYEAVGNRVLTEVMRQHWMHIRRLMAATLAIAGYPKQVWDEHSAILDAIEAHDADRAGMLAAAHTKAASARLLENLSGDLAPQPDSGFDRPESASRAS
jgi:DNA-binding GntR family transcriptional regulator